MGHRIFIAINLPESIKKKLADYKFNWPELPGRWTKKDNLHITLVFIGYVRDEEIPEISQQVKKAALENHSFSINLNKIRYAPPKKIPPRMIWVEGEKSKEFTVLKDSLDKALTSDKINFSPEKRVFSPHITLARIRQWEFRKIELEAIPDISKDISFEFEVNSIEVMESQLKKGGPEYTILESCPLKS